MDVLADVAGRAAQAEVYVAVDGRGALLGGVTFAPPGSAFHLVEGHTRLGILRGRLGRGMGAPEQQHTAYVGRAR